MTATIVRGIGDYGRSTCLPSMEGEGGRWRGEMTGAFAPVISLAGSFSAPVGQPPPSSSSPLLIEAKRP